MKWNDARSSSSLASVSSPSPPQLTTTQSFLIVVSSICGQICVGTIFILNFYITYFISYVRLRGSYPDMGLTDGKMLLLLTAASYGISGYPLGCILSGVPTMTSLTVGAGFYALGYLMIWIGVAYIYSFLYIAAIFLGASAMLINLTILLNCLMSFRENWGIVSGALLGIAFGTTGMLHIWETEIVNPLNITPTDLDSTTVHWYYSSETMLDRCGQLYWILGACLAVLILFPIAIYRLFPAPLPQDDEEISCSGPWRVAICSIWMDVRFILSFTAYGFGGVAGLCTRSSLKLFGESFIADENYLSKVGASGSLAAAVGALCMGIMLDMSGSHIIASHQTAGPKTSSKLLLFNCLLGFTGTVMMMFAPNFAKLWFLFCYDIILFAFGGFSAIIAMVLLEIFGISKYAVAFGITSLMTFFSALWYTFSVFSGLPWRDFWLANALFSFMGVVSAIGLLLQGHMTGHDDADEEDEEEIIFYQGNKYKRFDGGRAGLRPLSLRGPRYADSENEYSAIEY